MRVGGREEPVPVPVVPDTPNRKIIDGWLVKWRDWQDIANQDVKVGVWFAYPINLEGWGLYSAYPGNCGAFVPGSMLDLMVKDFQTLPTIMSSDEDLAVFKAQALDRLKELIWTVGAPPYDPLRRPASRVA